MNRRASSARGRELPMAAGTLDPAQLPSYAYETYTAIGLNDLLAYVVAFLEGKRQTATFENIVVAVHHMFPAKFSLVGYPQFPDAARVQLVILHLGPKYVGWLEGKKKTGYYLNGRGKEAATGAAEILGAPTAEGAPPHFAQDNLANRTAVETRIAKIRDSESFKRYIATDGHAIDDVTLAWEAFGLFITADSLTKAETYRQLVEATRRQGDAEVEQFLSWVAKERPHLAGRGTPSKQSLSKRQRAKGRSRP